MATQVRVTDGTYRGAKVEGVFELVAGFKAMKGDVETRRNGRGGEGFIKLKHNGTLVKCANEVARVTVAGENVGYEVFEALAEALAVEATADLEIEVAEQAVETETVSEEPAEEPAEQSAVDALLDALFADDESDAEAETVSEVVESTPIVTDEIAELEAQLDGTSGAERANLRKRIARRKAKLGA